MFLTSSGQLRSALLIGASAAVMATLGSAVNAQVVFHDDTSTTTAGATATGVGSTAGGLLATANGNATTAVGGSAAALADNATAIGGSANATAVAATGVGNGSQATSANTTAIGTGSQAQFTGDTALGNGANASGSNSVAVGINAASSGSGSVGIGISSNAAGQDSVALGNAANNAGLRAIAIGAGTSTTQAGSVALGGGASSTSVGGTALGDGAVVSGGAGNSAIGANARFDSTDNTNLTTAANAGLGTLGGTAIAPPAADTTTTGVSFGVTSGDGGSVNTRLINVAAGRLSAASTDVVNGSQLFGIATTLQTNIDATTTGLGGIAAALGGGAANNSTTGAVTAPAYAVQGSTYTDVGSAVGALNTGLTGNTTAISNLTTTLNNGAIGPVQYTGTNTAVIVAKGGSAAAPGATQTLSNVAAATLSAASTQAVNGAQLFSTNRHVAGDTAALGGGAAYNDATGNYTAPTYVVQGASSITVGAAVTALNAAVSAGLASGVQYDSATHTSVTLDPGGAAAQVRNVANGTLASDAVNLGQLQSSAATGLATAESYTDGRINGLNYDLRRQIDITGARTSAIAGVPQAVIPGAGFVGGSVGGQGSQVAFAVGLSKVFAAKHNPVIKAGVAVGTAGKEATYNVGAGFHF